jgi:membrane protein implicated in regulation of membrane protease activity
MPMELFNQPLEIIYLYALIISAILTVLYVLFGDLLDFDGPDILNPVLILAFVTIFSASSYLIEKLSSIHFVIIIAISAVLALILVTLLNVFVLVPMAAAEESLVYREKDLRGRIGTVITAIPLDGYGEVMIENISGRIAKPASSFDHQQIANGAKVLVVDVKDGILQVTVHQEEDSYIF